MSVVVIGELSGERGETLRMAVLRAKEEPAFYWDLDDTREALLSDRRPVPKAILVDATSADVEQVLTWVRQTSSLFAVPVVVMLPSLDGDAFREVYGLGADDAVQLDDTRGVTRRLEKLAEFDPTERPSPVRGDVVVAHPDVSRRATLGRILRIAGFNLRFADSGSELWNVVHSGQPPELVVMTDDLGGTSGRGEIHRLRASGGERASLPVILLGPRSEQRALRDAAKDLGDVLVERELAPPDNLLFLTNEVLIASARNMRASPRVLHGDMVSFRAEGTLFPSFGLSYNLSEMGMYSRTLDPPARGTRVWLELVPPGARHAVHIRAEVMWGQKLTNRRGSPPGFGVRFLPDACAAADLDHYATGYRSLADL